MASIASAGYPSSTRLVCLSGIITNRDMRFISVEDRKTMRVAEAMTRMPLITGHPGISREAAAALFKEHRIEKKLPLVDANGKLNGSDHSKRLRQRRGIPELGEGWRRTPARRRRDGLLR